MPNIDKVAPHPTTPTASRRNTKGLSRRGRPKGSKNKTTVFKEAMQQGFEQALQKDFTAVLEAVISQAKKGDMKAAKMLMDRVVPVSKAVDMDQLKKGGLTISINVGEMEKPEVIEGKIVNEEDTIDG